MVAAALACWATRGFATATAAEPGPAGRTGTIRDVQHVVIFMQENRSFDHYFGALRGVRGFADPTALQLPDGHPAFRQPDRAAFVWPFPVKTQCLTDLDHGWSGGHAAWDSGRWDRWVPAKSATTMAYYTRAELPFHYALADAYTICDAYYCSVLGPSNPNRLYLWTGMIDPRGAHGGPVIDNREPVPGFTWTTYPERLQSAGVSWKVFQEADNYDDNALAWFARYQTATPGDPLYDLGLAIVPDLVTAFGTDVRNGTLPRVSWLIAPTVYSEHPPFSPASGAELTGQLLNALAANPEVFNTTVFILNFDENDGLFDHVPPPTPPAGTPDEFVGGQPIGLGVRVPCIIVSPWTRGGYVCSQVFDHTSVLRFLETWTGVAEPNLSAWRRELCGDLTSAFDFANPDYTVPELPGIAAVNCGNGVTPPVPSVQQAPTQESGTRPRRLLPYQPDGWARVGCSPKWLNLTLTNAGAAAIHLAIYPNAHRNDAPVQLDVAAGGSATIGYDLTVAAGQYDFTCYGPDGFLRRFAGDASVRCAQVEVSPTLDPDAGSLNLALQNASAADVTYSVVANRGEAGPWAYLVPAGDTVVAKLPIQPADGGEYDYTATVTGDPSFLRRFAGRIEIQPRTQLSISYANGTLNLTWANDPAIRLQATADLTGGAWSDVADTLGAGSASVPAKTAFQYFRLVR